MVIRSGVRTSGCSMFVSVGGVGGECRGVAGGGAVRGGSACGCPVRQLPVVAGRGSAAGARRSVRRVAGGGLGCEVRRRAAHVLRNVVSMGWAAAEMVHHAGQLRVYWFPLFTPEPFELGRRCVRARCWQRCAHEPDAGLPVVQAEFRE